MHYTSTAYNVYRKAQQEGIHRKYSSPIHSYQHMFTLVSVLNVVIFYLLFIGKQYTPRRQ